MAENEKLELDALSLKGFRDFLPAQKRKRDFVIGVLKQNFELYGFEPLETPAIERFEVLSMKFAGGEQIFKEMYTFEDQGKRKLALRYDLTVPLCRVMAENPRIPLPFKRYQIQPVWRDGPTKLGRYREFTQCDADVVGVEGPLVEAELLLLALNAFEKLGIDVVVRFSNRKFLNGLLDACGVPTELREGAILSLDKLEKVGAQAVEAELCERGLAQEAAKRILAECCKKGANRELMDYFAPLISASEGQNGLADLEKLYLLLTSSGVDEAKLEFCPSLARGLNYYTGTVFEFFLKDQSKISSSVAAGGRYLNTIFGVANSTESLPSSGISFGLDVICDALDSQGKSLGESAPAKIFVIPIKTNSECVGIAEQFRKLGVSTSMDLTGKNVGKCLEYAAKMNYPFAAIVGKNELDKGVVTLRNMATGEQKELSVADAAKIILA